MGCYLNRLDAPVFMAVSKPLLIEFGIYHRLESCVPYLLSYMGVKISSSVQKWKKSCNSDHTWCMLDISNPFLYMSLCRSSCSCWVLLAESEVEFLCTSWHDHPEFGSRGLRGKIRPLPGSHLPHCHKKSKGNVMGLLGWLRFSCFWSRLIFHLGPDWHWIWDPDFPDPFF